MEGWKRESSRMFVLVSDSPRTAARPPRRSSVELESAFCRVKQMQGTDSTLFI